MRIKISIIASLITLALLDIISRVVYCSRDGLIYALNDPGKSVFHLIILPIAVYLFIETLPTTKAIFNHFDLNTKRAIWPIIIIISLIFAFIFVNEQKLYCSTKPTKTNFLLPHDIPQQEKRNSLVVLRRQIYEAIIQKRDSAAITNKMDQYSDTVVSAKKDCHFFSGLTFFTIVSYTETAVGTIFGGFIFLAMSVLVIFYRNTKLKLVEALINKYLIIGFIVGTEVIFRIYSEYYINFLQPDSTSLFATYLIGGVLIIFTILYLIRNAGKGLQASLIIIFPVFSGIVAFLSKFNIVKEIITNMYALDWYKLASIYLLFLFLLLFLIYISTSKKSRPKIS